MDNKKETTDVAVNSEGKKKPGRKPMTAAEKEAAIAGGIGYNL